MNKTRIAAGTLALAMLAGCSTDGGPGILADPDDMAYQAADLKRDSQLFTVDGEGVSAEEYLFWLVNAIAEQKRYGLLSDDSDWSQAAEGQPSAETLKADALETAKLYQVIRNHAKELGAELTAEEREELEATQAQEMEYWGGEEAFRGLLEEQCISLEGYRALSEVAYLNQALEKKLEETGQLTPTDADVDSYLEEMGIYAAKHILVATRHTNEDGSHEEYNDEERAQAEALVKDIRERLRADGDSEVLFDELMNEYSEDGRNKETGELYYPHGYTYVYPGQMVTEFEEGALALEVGQISEPIQTSYGYHIIFRGNPDGEQAMEECGSYLFYKLEQTWLEEAQVVTTKAYDELDPQAFYDRLQELVKAKAAARATPAPTESAAPEESTQPEASPAG